MDNNFGISNDWSIRHCVATITAYRHIERGVYIQPTTHGTMQKCTITEILMDPLGDMHFPTIVGYTIDDIEDGCTGRAVINM